MIERKVYLARGVGRSLFIAFLIVSLFSFGAAILGSVGLSFVSDAQNEVLEDVYPAVQNAQQIALQSTALVLGLPSLSNNDSIQQLEQKETVLRKQEGKVFELLEIARASKHSGAVFNELEPEVQTLSKNFRLLATISRRTIEINGSTRRQIEGLSVLASDIINHAKAARAYYGSDIVTNVESVRKSLSSDGIANTTNLFDNFIDGNLNIFKEVSDIQFRAETLKEQLLGLEDITNLPRLKRLKDDISLNFRAITRILVRLKDKDLQSSFAKPVSRFSKTIVGDETIFTLKEQSIGNIERADEIRNLTEVAGESVRLVVAKFVDDIQLTMDDKSSTVQSTTRNTQITLIVFALLALIVSILIYIIYINNNIIYRLQRLYEATLKFNQGNFLVPVATSGNDEISDLEGAIENFRLNSMKLQKTERELKYQTEDLKRSNHDLEQFAYVTSHDLRAPLRGLNSLSEWIEEDIQAGNMKEVSDNLKRMRGRVARMDALLNGILRYSRAGYEVEKSISIPVKSTLEDIFDDMNPEGHFTLDIQCTVDEIFAKDAFFKQVSGNLIANAIKHHDKATGAISVEVLQKQESYHLIVCDDGPGIPEKMHARIFKIFQTLKPQDDIEASGIGLSLVKRLVDRNKGTISIESSESGGAKFTVIWPRTMK